MANKPLTADEWRDSVQQIWDEAIRDSIQDQIREAVLAEREACAKICKDLRKKISNDANGKTVASHCAIAILARGQ